MVLSVILQTNLLAIWIQNIKNNARYENDV